MLSYTIPYRYLDTYILRFGKDLFTLGKRKGGSFNSAHGKRRTAGKGRAGSKGRSHGGGQGKGTASESELHGQVVDGR
jgi:hypothetical protein